MSEADFTPLDAETKVSSLYRPINTRTEALRSLESSTSFPSSPVAGQFLFRTDVGWVFQRNTGNTAWIPMWQVDAAPWGPHRVALNTAAVSSWVSSTELASDPGGGVEDEGLDLFLVCQMVSGGTDLTIKLNDDADWAYRRFWVSYTNGIGDRVIIQRESDSALLLELEHSGEWALLQVNSTGTISVVAANLGGTATVTSGPYNVGTTTNWWKRRFMCDGTSGAFQVNLPVIGATTVGQQWPVRFTKTDATGAAITVAATDNINGVGSVALAAQYDTVTIEPDIDAAMYRIC